MSGEEYRKLKCSQENFAFLCNKCFDESTIASNLLNKRKRFVNPKYGLTFVKKTQRRNTSNASNAKRLANKQASFTICLSDVRGVISTFNFLLFICFSFFRESVRRRIAICRHLKLSLSLIKVRPQSKLFLRLLFVQTIR